MGKWVGDVWIHFVVVVVKLGSKILRKVERMN